MKLLEFLLDLLFPPRCPVCGQIVPIGKKCADCTGALELLELNLEEIYKANAERNLEYVDSAVSVYRYDSAAKELVHRYKFDDRRILVNEMADRMASLAREVYEGAALDGVLCVPAFEEENDHGKRLAEAVAARMGLPFLAQSFVKIRRTEKQHELGAAERATNLSGAFSVPDPTMVAGKRLLICDDVITSGSTLNECAKTLKEAGAAYVFAVSFAATGRAQDLEEDKVRDNT